MLNNCIWCFEIPLPCVGQWKTHTPTVWQCHSAHCQRVTFLNSTSPDLHSKDQPCHVSWNKSFPFISCSVSKKEVPFIHLLPENRCFVEQAPETMLLDHYNLNLFKSRVSRYLSYVNCSPYFQLLRATTVINNPLLWVARRPCTGCINMERRFGLDKRKYDSRFVSCLGIGFLDQSV